MKKSTRRFLIGFGAVIGALVVLRIAAAFVWPTINDVRTGATPEYPDLQVQRFPKPVDQVFAAALATARELGLEVTSTGEGRIVAVASTRVFRFTRVGKGDLGANARRIRDFQAGLAGRLGADR